MKILLLILKHSVNASPKEKNVPKCHKPYATATFQLSLLLEDLHCKSALLLSWIDYEDLCLDLLNLYQGDMVISFGNYNVLCPKYKLKLEQDFLLTKKITLNMPWGLDEDIELYIKKN